MAKFVELPSGQIVNVGNVDRFDPAQESTVFIISGRETTFASEDRDFLIAHIHEAASGE